MQVFDRTLVEFRFLLVIDSRDDVAAENPEPARTILNFHVDDFDVIAARLREAGVEWAVPVEDRAMGRFGTFADPDGNLLQIIQFVPDAHAATAP
ncbi:VOC family protein [Nocardia jejuensis]|uniref:VOC family protein n=1 Tax=Nocardia jejuensis TaxID=328049 RepID=UPI000A605D3F|nr:VOC family protein [Nocardia jejuensis]